MKDLSFTQMSDALGLTRQQLEIIIALYRLESSSRRTSPKAMRDEYMLLSGATIQNPNFFSQTKQLQDLGFIKRVRPARYAVDLGKIKKTLAHRREEKEKELTAYESLIDETAAYFQKIASESVHPVVEYLDYDKLFASMSRKVRAAKTMYMVGNFPTISYAYEVASGIGRGEFVKTLLDRCVDTDKLEFKYLTSLDADYPFNHAFRVYGDPAAAYRETKIILETLRNQIESHNNIDVRYLKDPRSIDIMIPEKRDPQEFYLFTRDEHKNIQGGIHIQSPETTATTKQAFLRDYEYAEPLSGPKGRKIIEKTIKEFEEKYKVCEA